MTKKRKRYAPPSPEAQDIKNLVYARMNGLDGYAAPEIVPQAPMTEDQDRQWRQRTIAELVSLPVMCGIRRCRRSRRCKGDEPVCLEMMSDIARERVDEMMRWSPSGSDDDE